MQESDFLPLVLTLNDRRYARLGRLQGCRVGVPTQQLLGRREHDASSLRRQDHEVFYHDGCAMRLATHAGDRFPRTDNSPLDVLGT